MKKLLGTLIIVLVLVAVPALARRTASPVTVRPGESIIVGCTALVVAERGGDRNLIRDGSTYSRTYLLTVRPALHDYVATNEGQGALDVTEAC